MITLLKELIGGKRRLGSRMQQERAQLEQLLTRFREERLSIDSMLTSAVRQTEALGPLVAALSELGKGPAAAMADLPERVEQLERRLAVLEGTDERVEAVKDALVVLRRGLQELDAGQIEVARLCEKVDVERRAFESFEQRVKLLQTER